MLWVRYEKDTQNPTQNSLLVYTFVLQPTDKGEQNCTCDFDEVKLLVNLLFICSQEKINNVLCHTTK